MVIRMLKPIRDCTIVSIPKCNKDPSSSDIYLPIPLAPTLSKALEWYALLCYPGHFLTSGLQFGFNSLHAGGHFSGPIIES